jgi:V8-like Glu-specific endopeptidase
MKKITAIFAAFVFFTMNAAAQKTNTVTIPSPAVSKNQEQINGRVCIAKVTETNIDFFENATKFSGQDTDTYKLVVNSEGASSLGVFLTDFTLEDGAGLIIRNADGTVETSAFSKDTNKSDRTLRTSQISGGSITMELSIPKNSPQKTFKISKVFYGLKNAENSLKKEKAVSSSCSSETDINSDEGFDYQDIKHAILKYSFEEDGFVYMCSGTLVNNYQNDGTPYVLTAAHCVCEQEEAETVIAYFNYEKTLTYSYNPHNQTIEGATLVATAPKITYKPSFGRAYKTPEMDFTLLKLSQTPPASFEPYYAGFTLDENTGLKTVACIHHPNGDYKKISISKSVPYIDTYPNEDDNTYYDINCHWHIAKWSVGTTESGSSGSPLLNSRKQIIGILSGGFASCTDPRDDFFQMFSKAWDSFPGSKNQLKYWLAGESGIISTEAYDPYNINVNYRKSEISGEVNQDTTVVSLSWQTAKTGSFENGFEEFESEKDFGSVFLANADLDNSGSGWLLYSDKGGDFQAFDGEKCAASLTPENSAANDYLTLPKTVVSASDVLSFAAKSLGGVSTLKISQNNKPSRYQTLEEISVPEEWTVYNIPLKDYAGSSLYLNFNNITPAKNATALLLDNIKIDKDPSLFTDGILTGRRLYCNNILINEFDVETTTFEYAVEKGRSYTFYVVNVYGGENVSGIANAVTFDFTVKTSVSDLIPENKQVTGILYPNPAEEKIFFKSGENFENATVEIFCTDGTKILESKAVNINKNTPYGFSLDGLKPGIYVFKISDGKNHVVKKFVVK